MLNKWIKIDQMNNFYTSSEKMNIQRTQTQEKNAQNN